MIKKEICLDLNKNPFTCNFCKECKRKGYDPGPPPQMFINIKKRKNKIT